ncbi:YiaA/YiaB family inner membrane protein [Sphaerotilus uruguayifluvii]|uniref:YiaAB two helix domain-containing protein n=1 Tax=Sphaerotilus uruguayifluvii TaxID=2735897 RepID=A0ABX2G0Q6_9BURK|nr:hypothetical protein [Leptothrix sp. C29]
MSSATASAPSAPTAADLPTELPAVRSRRLSSGRPQRDSRAWRAQVWISFGLAVALCAGGLAGLPGQSLDRAFMVMGYLFCLCSAFVLSKFVRDRESRPDADTPMWAWVVRGGFAMAMGLTAWGLWRMQVDDVWKAYLGVSWLYLISSVFTLAKTLRDAWEAER